MKIAVIGAGFAGLAIAWHCSTFARVVLFDPEVGGGASGVAAGLLHPFTGSAKQVAPWAFEGMQEAKRLLLLAGQPIRSEIVRYPLDDEEKRRFSRLPLQYSGVRWEGKLIIEGVVVDAKRYLKSLLQLCLDKGVQLIEERVSSLEELKGFDARVVAAGAGVVDFASFKQLRLMKGQMLVYEKPFPEAAIGLGYVAGPYLGATFESRFEKRGADFAKALELLAPARAFFQEKELPLDAVAGVRVMGPPGVFPLIEEIDQFTWVVSGLGSKGLLTHGLIGKLLAERIKSRILGP